MSDGAAVNDLGATGRRVRQVARAVAPCSLVGECSQVCPAGIPLTAIAAFNNEQRRARMAREPRG